MSCLFVRCSPLPPLVPGQQFRHALVSCLVVAVDARLEGALSHGGSLSLSLHTHNTQTTQGQQQQQ